MYAVEKTYTVLCALFAVLIVVGNLIYQKFIILNCYFYKFEVSAGILLYPVTFLITDLIAEFYNKDKANLCVKIGISMNILTASLVSIVSKLDVASWSNVDNITFNNVFGFYNIAFIGSIIACYISQRTDIFLYLLLKKATNDRYLWIRNSISTLCSLLIDTTIVICFMTFFGALPAFQLVSLVLHSYSFKLLFTLINIPIFYILVLALKAYLNKKPAF